MGAPAASAPPLGQGTNMSTPAELQGPAQKCGQRLEHRKPGAVAHQLDLKATGGRSFSPSCCSKSDRLCLLQQENRLRFQHHWNLDRPQEMVCAEQESWLWASRALQTQEILRKWKPQGRRKDFLPSSGHASGRGRETSTHRAWAPFPTHTRWAPCQGGGEGE